MSITLYGLFAKILSSLLPVKEKCWIFGADYGRMYREGSRYLFEYMIKEHPDYNCTFITRSKDVKKRLDENRLPCELNFSIRGMIKIAQAEYAFTTQMPNDILFVFKKKNRKFIYLCHGQPYKAVFKATPKDYYNKNRKKNLSILERILISPMSRFFSSGYNYWDSLFYVSTSDFLVPYNKKYFGDNVTVLTLGMPRNDILFDEIKIKNERWLPNLENKTIITYMPTHRNYGKGKIPPIPFINNKNVIEWLRRNNVVLLIKQHPNMKMIIEGSSHVDVIVDISNMKFDPQVCLYHSDALITDYSSVWIDYLILQRPLLFYYVDDYEKNDVGVLYDIKEEPPGPICYSENDLFVEIQKIKLNYDDMRPSDRIVSKYHKYKDGNSCKRVFDAITNR